MSIQKSVKELIKAINTPKGTEPYDTVAEVVRVDEETAWVHIPGGVDETPVKKTIDAVKGDKVQIRVGGGTAWIVGNESKPPTDDRVANVAQKTAENADLKAILAKKTADEASKVATNYIDFTEEDGLTVGYKDLNSKVNISGDGVKLYDEDGNVGTEIKSGFVQVGQSNGGHTTVQEGGMDIYGGDGTEKLAHIGYGEGEAETGTANAPYFDFGVRVAGKPIGNYSFLNGRYSTASGYASHAEGTGCKALGQYSHAEGLNTIASGNASHAEGYMTEAFAPYQTVVGRENDISNNDLLFIVGKGNGKNAFAVDKQGNAFVFGDVYAQDDYGDSREGNKLVSASTSTGSGTKANMASSTNLSNLAELTLPDKGVYILVGLARFPSNSNGRRGLAWGTSATGYYDHSSVVVPPASGAVTRIQSVAIVTATSEDYKVYLNAYHTAGTSLNVDYYWRYIKLA